MSDGHVRIPYISVSAPIWCMLRSCDLSLSDESTTSLPGVLCFMWAPEE